MGFIRMTVLLIVFFVAIASTASANGGCNEINYEASKFFDSNSPKSINYTIPSNSTDPYFQIQILENQIGSGIFPSSDIDPNGNRRIVLHREFPEIFCNFALYEWLATEGLITSNLATVAAVNGEDCIAKGRQIDVCLVIYSTEISNSLQEEISRMSQSMQASIPKIISESIADGIYFLYAHEVVHHLDRHFQELALNKSFTRDQAERDADLTSFVWGATSERSTYTLNLFFKHLGGLERSLGFSQHPAYEKTICRALNHEQLSVTGLFFEAIGVIFRDGGRADLEFKLEIKRLLELGNLHDDIFELPENYDGCEGYSNAVLEALSFEAMQYLTLFAEHKDVLYAPDNYVHDPAFITPLFGTYEERVSLLTEAFSMGSKIRISKSYFAKAVSEILVRATQTPNFEYLDAKEVEEAYSQFDGWNSVRGEAKFQNAIGSLYLASDSSDDAKRAYLRSIELLPTLSDSLLNLAVISFLAGECMEMRDYWIQLERTSVNPYGEEIMYIISTTTRRCAK